MIPLSYAEKSSSVNLHLFIAAVVFVAVIAVFSIVLCSKCKKKKNASKSISESTTVTKTEFIQKPGDSESEPIKRKSQKNSALVHMEAINPDLKLPTKFQKSQFQTQSQKSKSQMQLQPGKKLPAISIKLTKWNADVNKELKSAYKEKAPADPKIEMKSSVMEKKIETSRRKSRKEISMVKQNKSAFSSSIAPKKQIKTVQSLPEPKPTSPTANIGPSERSTKSKNGPKSSQVTTTKQFPKTSPTTTNTSPAMTKADSMMTARSAPETQSRFALIKQSKMAELQSIAKQADSNYNKKEIAVSQTAGKIVKETPSKATKQQEYKPDHTYYGVPMNMDME